MGGLWYQAEARQIVDYDLFSLDGSDEMFREPRFELIDGEYVTFVGAARSRRRFAARCRRFRISSPVRSSTGWHRTSTATSRS